MNTLEYYVRMFSKLRRAPGNVWGPATRNQAPHKPLLLLALLDLAARGVITSSFMDVSADLVELNDLFTSYWRRVVPISQSSSIAFPFSRLHNEPFWQLVPQPGHELTPAVVNNITTVSQLRNVALGGRMDENLFLLMQSPENRSALRQALLYTCFSEEARASLAVQAEINAQAFDYSRELEFQAHLPLVGETLASDDYMPAARDQGFRRIVVKAYDHRCALCGVRIVTPEGHTVVDAAHIIPWSKSQNDDIRNGMALCKLCHWAFDEGMMGVSDNYNVITSRQINTNPNVPGFLLTLSGRGIIGPPDHDFWPARQYLADHRSEKRLSS